MTEHPSCLTATEARAHLRDGTFSVETLARACLDRIEDREPQVQAWSDIDADRILIEAQRLDALPAAARGPLHGVPIGVKDVLLTRDMPTRYGSLLYSEFAPEIDASAVAVLRAAGALLFGKTHTIEFAAIGTKPPTTNPWNKEHTPGGSSSGSAAAVADRHVPLALGTQTGGSIIRPASFCGTWALKPTWGLVDRDGVKMFAASLDTVGWFGRSAEDLGLLLESFEPSIGMHPAFVASDRPHVAICRTPMWQNAESATRHAFAEAEFALKTAGFRVTRLTLPACFEPLARDHETIMFGEGRRSFLAAAREHGALLNMAFRKMVDEGPSVAEVLSAYNRAATARAIFDELASRFDAILAPSVCGEAPYGLTQSGSYSFNGMWTLLHTPCVNIPGLTGPTGLPIGMTATGPRFADAQIVAIAGIIGDALRLYAARS